MPNRSNIQSPVSLLGAPRSGTTLIASLFRLHPEFDPQPVGETANLMFGAWSSIDLARGVTKPTERHKRLLSSGERAGLGVRELFLGLFPDRSIRWAHKPIGLPKAVSERFGDDEWDDAAAWYWNVWEETFPDASIAVILRNPWDVVASQRARFGFTEESLWWSYSFLTHILAAGHGRVNHVVRYESLVTDQETQTRELFSRAGVEFDPKVLEAFKRQHVPNADGAHPAELAGPTGKQRDIISAGFETLGQPLDWPTSAASRSQPQLAEEPKDPGLEVARLERRFEQHQLDAAAERYELWTEIARWRKIVGSNRHVLELDVETHDELERQLDEGAQAQANEARREAYIRELETELDRIYGSKTWRAASQFFQARIRYRREGVVAGARTLLSAPVVHNRVQDFRERALPKPPSTNIGVPSTAVRGIGLVLPSGITLGGVTSWAIEMAGELSERRRTAVMLHPDTGPPIQAELSSRVEVFPATSPAVPGPRGAERLSHEYAAGLPAVFVPNYNYAGYAMLAELSEKHADRIRVVGMAHTDQLHYYSLLAFYEPIIHTFVAVSAEIAAKLKRLLPAERSDDIAVMPYGVRIPELEKQSVSAPDEPLRLVYAGRLEAEQKRVTRLVDLADRLSVAGVHFTLDIVGDGEEKEALRAAIATLPHDVQDRLQLRGAVQPDEMSSLWQSHDVCVLVSAYEGTSIAMLEAMANGCVPVVTAVSGTEAVLSDASVGITCDRDDLDHMVREIKALDDDRPRLQTMSDAAREKVKSEYAFTDHAHAFEDLCIDTWQADSRVWPSGHPVVPVDRLSFEHDVQRRVQR